eukprot:EC720789.1.p1 GENE.EC720789.1~~EC720789.1.p1  ORF type:complete len:115 (+),score=5.34 EC720789.1:37-381(+)
MKPLVPGKTVLLVGNDNKVTEVRLERSEWFSEEDIATPAIQKEIQTVVAGCISRDVPQGVIDSHLTRISAQRLPAGKATQDYNFYYDDVPLQVNPHSYRFVVYSKEATTASDRR